MPIDHAMVAVQKDVYDETLKIYVEALKPLGYKIGMQFGPTVTGMQGESDIPGYTQCDFWINGVDVKPNAPLHLALRAKDRATVDAFHAAAIKAGAQDNGAPGIRSHYHANYYAAFFVDAAGNNVEAVCHKPE